MNPDRELLDVADLPKEVVESRMREVTADLSYKDALQIFEREYITLLLQGTKGNITEVARISGLSRGHLHRKIKQLEIEAEDYR